MGSAECGPRAPRKCRGRAGLWPRRLAAGLLAFVFAACLSVPGASPACADVRKADVILGLTVDSRGLSVADCPSIDAEYAVVMAKDGTVFFEREATQSAQIASITKVMTALVALEHAPKDTIVTVSERATFTGESSASLLEGDLLTLEAALWALLLSSGNDAATAIAECVGGIISKGSTTGADAEQAFVDRMNAKATEMGLHDTYFENPHGLDDNGFEGDQRSCAIDVAHMVKLAMQDESFRAIVATAQVEITVTREDGSDETLKLESTDQMLGAFEGACGVKTGFTDLAGPSFAGAANRDGQEYYAIVLFSSDADQRFVDAQILLQWVYDHNIEYPLAHSDQHVEIYRDGELVSVPVVAEVAHADWIDQTVKATLSDPNQRVPVFDLNGNINQTVEYDTVRGNVRIGDKVGTITFKQRNDVLVTVDMVACEEVKAPGFIEGIRIWWDRLLRGFSGQRTVAYSVLVNQTPLLNPRGGAS
ncbi:MAG: D-alanyl-D-alanine carboxypeptidase [Coriobacteriaceae bacterium]|nr:D-alanyl-D-alanine carboxypeptidase [Coriobacteriaceae bacterium]